MLYLNETMTGDKSMFSFDPVKIEGKADNQTVPKSRNGMATDLKRAQETAQTA
jgi:predicted alpha/beta hydrolase family esterase